MFSVAQTLFSASRLSRRPLAFRSFAQVVHAPTSNDPSATQTQVRGRTLAETKIPVREDHGLYAFFRRKEHKDGEVLVADAKYETVETPEKMQKVTGRSWRASELRLKSFNDLHTLWYILLRERNLLATQKEEARRMGVVNPEMQVSSTRVHQCRKSMARIKAVLNERRLAYEGAVKLIEESREKEESAKVQQYLETTQRKQKRYLKRRRFYEVRMLETRASATDPDEQTTGESEPPPPEVVPEQQPSTSEPTKVHVHIDR